MLFDRIAYECYITSMAQSLEYAGLEVSALYVIGSEKIWTAQPYDEITLDWAGIPGDRHFGMTRIMQPYESEQLSKLKIANDKQLSVVSEIDMREVAEELDLPIDTIEERAEKPIVNFMAEQFAANLLVVETDNTLNDIAGVGVVATFGKNPDDVSSAMRITEYNEPCKKPLINLLSSLGKIGLVLPGEFDEQKERFKKASASRRGWVGSVYKAGRIATGHLLFTHQPVQLPSVT